MNDCHLTVLQFITIMDWC